MALTRRQLLMIKAESTYGTSSSPTGAEAILVLDPKLSPLDAKALEREIIDPAFGRVRSRVMTERKLGLQFGVEVAGSGTAGTAPKFGPLLRACGMSETIVAATSVTYAPVTPATDSVTCYHNWDGNSHVGTGARGTLGLTLTTGEIPKWDFTMTGIYNSPTDVAFPTPTYTNQAAPVAANFTNTTSVSIASLSACMAEFSLTLGNDIQFFEHMGCTPQVRIQNRMVEGSITIERPDSLSTKDFYALALAGTTGAISFTHGATAGNRLAVSIPTANFGAPEPADLRGTAGLKIPFVGLHTAGSSDEVSFAFT